MRDLHKLYDIEEDRIVHEMNFFTIDCTKDPNSYASISDVSKYIWQLSSPYVT
jgi:hypothetical protein